MMFTIPTAVIPITVFPIIDLDNSGVEVMGFALGVCIADAYSWAMALLCVLIAVTLVLSTEPGCKAISNDKHGIKSCAAK
jgi:hypothetical protein